MSYLVRTEVHGDVMINKAEHLAHDLSGWLSYLVGAEIHSNVIMINGAECVAKI